MQSTFLFIATPAHPHTRLSEYIGQTTALTAENKRLRHDLDVLNGVFATLDERLRKQYEDEMKNLRAALDKALVDKAAALKKVIDKKMCYLSWE